MALRVNYNYQADFGHVNLMKNERNLNTSLERLESGLRINSAKDDAAGLFIADQLNLVAKALDQGSRNANDGISASQIAESTLAQVYDKLTSMYTKASQAATDTNDPNARAALQRDIEAIVDAIDRMANQSEFNGIKLLNGARDALKIQYGPRAGQALDVNLVDARASKLGAGITTFQETNGFDATKTFSDLISGDDNYRVDVTDKLAFDFDNDGTNDKTVNVGEKILAKDSNATVLDASKLAEVLQEDGFSYAKATNKVTAKSDFSDISVGAGGSLKINLYVGADTTADISLEYGANTTVTLDDLISKINAQDKGVIASKDGSKLVLETKNGESIGVEIVNNTGSAVDLAMFSTADSGTDVENGATGSVLMVGKLDIVDAQLSKETTIKKSGLGLNNYVRDEKSLKDLNVEKYDDATMAMAIIDSAIKKVDKGRSELGSIQQKLQAIIDNNDFAATQTREAESRIRNVDFAKEMAEFTKSQTLMQSGVAMLAQAKQLPQMMLQLLR